MTKIPFTKMSGAANDFIIIDNRRQYLDADHLGDWVQKLCTRKYSVGGDGLILIEPSHKADFKWRFFNCDGLEADMCGNGSRCAARFSYLEGITGPKLSFETRAGIIHAEVNGRSVKVKITEPSQLKPDIQLSTERGTITLSRINTGVPHAVLEMERLEDFTLQTLKELGQTIRSHKYFQPTGANVNFVEVLTKEQKPTLKVKTYERGVEDITQACGTGVVASALIAHAKKWINASPVLVKTMGGDLTIYFEENEKSYTNVCLEGDARIVFRGELTDESV
jgi:diaminopimelate epimerase